MNKITVLRHSKFKFSKYISYSQNYYVCFIQNRWFVKTEISVTFEHKPSDEFEQSISFSIFHLLERQKWLYKDMFFNHHFHSFQFRPGRKTDQMVWAQKVLPDKVYLLSHLFTERLEKGLTKVYNVKTVSNPTFFAKFKKIISISKIFDTEFLKIMLCNSANVCKH